MAAFKTNHFSITLAALTLLAQITQTQDSSLMSIDTPLNNLLHVQHPILLAAMDLVADARLTLAVSEAGGFGILGGGYGDADWLGRELALLVEARASENLPYGVGFITWSLANQPDLLDQAPPN